MLSRRAFLAALGSAAAIPAFQTRKPNIVHIVADDLGYAEIGVQGCKDIPTPAIDSIAKNGVRFTSGYVSCPVCSPTRAGLLTGRYQQRFGHELNPGPATQAEENFGLPLDQVTLPQVLRDLGYRTGHVGKWHLGYKPEYHPNKRGFDESFGFPGGAHAYLDRRAADEQNAVNRNGTPVDEKAYLTDAFAREAVAFVDRHAKEPFYLYLPFNAVHAPLQATQKYLDRFANISDERRRTYAAMMVAMDDAIGAVLARLRHHRIEDDTLVIFHSDNGGPTMQTTSSNGPLHGFKGQTYEGGIRVPFLMQWKRRLKRGVVDDRPIISLDIFPTCVAAAGGKPAANLDGVDLLPYLTGARKEAPHEALFWRFGAQWAVRKGDWKLIESIDGVRLFHLTQDLGETKDLAAAEPGKAKELQAAYDAWNASNIAPRWGTRRAGGGGKKGGKKKRKL
ncbi:MAG: sulfatase [Bryobacterales bacterium]|nr:sulfatase [Bryobacterales bacterium]